MNIESIAEMVRNWLAGVGDVLSVEELLERIMGREQWTANEIAWRDRLNYQHLENLEKSHADNAALRRQLAECQADRSEVLRAIDLVIAERDAAHVALDAAQATMRNMRRDEYAHVREDYPPGRTLIVPPDVSGSTTAAQVADAEDYPPTE